MSAIIRLADIERVPLTEAWPAEDRNFTPWLAESEPIAKLGDALGLDLEVESIEHWVGPFRADIIAKVTSETDHRVLIENQFGRTDHKHLGQMMTYLAGIEYAKTVVWIAESIQPDHRAALDWLNSHTDEEFSFFAVEIELWRIAGSPPAPKFNVVASPNDWTRQARTAARSALDDVDRVSHQVRLAYWASMSEYLKNIGSLFSIRRPNRDHWFSFPIGRAGFAISATISTAHRRIGVALYASNDPQKRVFRTLLDDKEQIEEEYGQTLDWQELPKRKAWRIGVFKHDCDPSDSDRFAEYHQWMAHQMERFSEVFRERVREIDLDADSSDEEGDD
ncbi:MAG: DUF4268 domain-containing protein [Hyphomonadaceae bacterium]